MTHKVQKIREKVEKLKSRLVRGACSSQVAMETRCKEEAYNEVLAILDTLQEEPAPKVFEDMLNAKTAAESLGISPEEHDKIVDECLYGKEPELVDVDDLPNKKEEPVSDDLPHIHHRDTLDEFAYQCAYDLSNDWAKETPEWKDVETACKLGAQWQKEHRNGK